MNNGQPGKDLAANFIRTCAGLFSVGDCCFQPCPRRGRPWRWSRRRRALPQNSYKSKMCWVLPWGRAAPATSLGRKVACCIRTARKPSCPCRYWQHSVGSHSGESCSMPSWATGRRKNMCTFSIQLSLVVWTHTEWRIFHQSINGRAQRQWSKWGTVQSHPLGLIGYRFVPPWKKHVAFTQPLVRTGLFAPRAVFTPVHEHATLSLSDE